MEAQPLNRQEVRCYNHLINYYFDDIEHCIFSPLQLALEFRVRTGTQAGIILTRLQHVGLLRFHSQGDYWRIRLTVKGGSGRVVR